MQFITIPVTESQLVIICSMYLGQSINIEFSDAERHAALTTHLELYKKLPPYLKDEIKKLDKQFATMPQKEMLQTLIDKLQQAHNEL